LTIQQPIPEISSKSAPDTKLPAANAPITICQNSRPDQYISADYLEYLKTNEIPSICRVSVATRPRRSRPATIKLSKNPVLGEGFHDDRRLSLPKPCPGLKTFLNEFDCV
jgi:hypothetical protein